MTTHYPDHSILLESETLILKDDYKGKRSEKEIIGQKNLKDLYGIYITVENINGREIVVPGGLKQSNSKSHKLGCTNLYMRSIKVKGTNY